MRSQIAARKTTSKQNNADHECNTNIKRYCITESNLVEHIGTRSCIGMRDFNAQEYRHCKRVQHREEKHAALHFAALFDGIAVLDKLEQRNGGFEKGKLRHHDAAPYQAQHHGKAQFVGVALVMHMLRTNNAQNEVDGMRAKRQNPSKPGIDGRLI